MIDDPETPSDDTYDPVPELMADGDILILDHYEFEAAFDCYAACNKGGQLFVLKKSTRRWESVESDEKPRGGLARVK
jgi:hypothetical protein